MALREDGTILSAPVVAGPDTTEDMPVAYNYELRGAFQRFATVNDLNVWTADYPSRVLNTTAIVMSDPAVWYRWTGTKDDGSDGSWQEFSPSESNNLQGIDLNDGTTSELLINKINLEGIKITKESDQGTMDEGEVTITSGINLHNKDSGGNGLANDVTVMFPLKTFDDPNGTEYSSILELEHGYFELAKAPSYLAYLKNGVKVLGKEESASGHRDGTIWFDDIIWPSGSYILKDEKNKALTIQEADQLDPNTTDGTDYLLAFRANFKGVAPVDGFIRIYLFDKAFNDFTPSGYLIDVNGNPIIVERHYKAGDNLGSLDAMGIVNAKGLKEFTCHVVDGFQGHDIELTDRAGGISGIIIQAITSTAKTGVGLLQFESDTKQSIEFSAHYLGEDIASAAFLTSQNKTMAEIQAGKVTSFNDGIEIYNLSKLNFGVESSQVIFQDSNSVADFNLHKIFSAEDTRLLGGKVITFNGEVINQTSAFNVTLFKWSGDPDEYTDTIFKTRNNGAIVLDAGWTEIDTLFIAEELAGNVQSVTKDFTVPNNSVNCAIAIYPVTPQSPTQLKVLKFQVNVKNPFIGYTLRAPELLSESLLYVDPDYKEFAQDNFNFASLRYTINNSYLPMPCGSPRKGNADISVDPTVNTVTGSAAKSGEGALKFDRAGEVSGYLEILVWNDTATNNNTTFTIFSVSPNGTVTGNQITSYSFDVPANSKGSKIKITIPDTVVEVGDRWALMAKSDKVNGAYIESVSPSAPMVKFALNFNELKAAINKYEDDLFAGFDFSTFTKTYSSEIIAVKDVSNASSVIIPIDIPSDASMSVLGAIKEMQDLSVRPVNKLDWTYSNARKELTVSFGETVLIGRVTIGVYL